MSYIGHALCRTRKLKLCLGKVRRVESRQPTGFGYAGLSDDDLGRVLLRFLAEHVKHDLIVAGDDLVDEMDNLREYDAIDFEVTPDGVSFRRRPLEPLVDRKKRISGGWIYPADGDRA